MRDCSSLALMTLKTIQCTHKYLVQKMSGLYVMGYWVVVEK